MSNVDQSARLTKFAIALSAVSAIYIITFFLIYVSVQHENSCQCTTDHIYIKDDIQSIDSNECATIIDKWKPKLSSHCLYTISQHHSRAPEGITKAIITDHDIDYERMTQTSLVFCDH